MKLLKCVCISLLFCNYVYADQSVEKLLERCNQEDISTIVSQSQNPGKTFDDVNNLIRTFAQRYKESINTNQDVDFALTHSAEQRKTIDAYGDCVKKIKNPTTFLALNLALYKLAIGKVTNGYSSDFVVARNIVDNECQKTGIKAVCETAEIMSNVKQAERFTTLGEHFKYSLPNNLCELHSTDPIEKNLLQQAKSTTPKADIPVFFVDCNSLNKVKSGIEVPQFPTFGAIKNLKQKYIFSKQSFLEEMAKRFNVDSASLNKLVDENMKKGAENLDYQAEVSASSTKYMGRDEDSIYIAGNSVLNGEKYKFISAFSLQKGVVFNIEIYSADKNTKTNELLKFVAGLKNNLK
ncbi:hypothetical protein SAMN02910357_00072 [Succinivibrio dextrinosolvens]|uniref:hypothetical protein n=1 Tax=Succinivibrio dextrinosolvens TaxID=83771 RepID=UPI0008EA1A9C|nr:hypothetical protein [Succinivibrio dextrinosolvens]SFS31844.1 hypothetical protein SAMN02910357_00072 [Succinivibrio dextrinosolvens]